LVSHSLTSSGDNRLREGRTELQESLIRILATRVTAQDVHLTRSRRRLIFEPRLYLLSRILVLFQIVYVDLRLAGWGSTTLPHNCCLRQSEGLLAGVSALGFHVFAITPQHDTVTVLQCMRARQSQMRGLEGQKCETS
jgi:hypothetical protein